VQSVEETKADHLLLYCKVLVIKYVFTIEMHFAKAISVGGSNKSGSALSSRVHSMFSSCQR